MMSEPDEDEAYAALFAERMAELTAGQGEGAALDAAMQRTTPWDIQGHVGTEAQQIAYLKAAFEAGDPEVIAAAIGDVARARGLLDIAEMAGESRATRYLALIDYDPNARAFGAAFPDAPGCTSMGATFDEAYGNAVDALREWAADRVAAGQPLPVPRDPAALRSDTSLADDFTGTAVLVLVPMVLDGALSVRVNISIEAGLAAEIDAAAGVHGLTRSAFLASAAREKIAASR